MQGKAKAQKNKEGADQMKALTLALTGAFGFGAALVLVYGFELEPVIALVIGLVLWLELVLLSVLEWRKQK